MCWLIPACVVFFLSTCRLTRSLMVSMAAVIEDGGAGDCLGEDKLFGEAADWQQGPLKQWPERTACRETRRCWVEVTEFSRYFILLGNLRSWHSCASHLAYTHMAHSQQPYYIISPKVEQHLMKRNKTLWAQGTNLAFKLLKSKSNECVQDAPE